MMDVGVCEVEGQFELDPATAWPVCLPGSVKSLPKIGETCEATGWGYYKKGPNDSRIAPDMLQGKKVQIEAYPSKGYIQFTGTLCNGDSGGPLTCTRTKDGKQRQVQYGVHSTGGACGEKWSAAANVAKMMEWIYNITKIPGI